MKNKKLRLLSFGIAAAVGLLLPSIKAHAAPDYEVHNAGENISGTWASANTDVLIGPNANIIVNGDWYITANNLYIHPSAIITGTGTIHIMNPSSYNGKAAATTMLDAGSVAIGPKVSIENGSTVTLTSFDPSVTYAASGFTETAPQLLLTDLNITNALNFGNTGAHIILGSNNVVLTAAATITRSDLNTAFVGVDPGASPNTAFLVTNGAGKVTKQGLPTATNFTYPVGFVSTNYTPGTVTNTSGSNRDLTVRVSDKATSGLTTGNAAHGLDRFWQITGPAAGTSTANLSLTHEAINQGASYDNGKDFITQQRSAGLWDSAAVDATPFVDARTAVVVPASGATSWFSKSDDTNTSISIRVMVSPVALLQGPLSGTTMTTTLNTLNLIPTSQPYNVAPFNYAGNEKVGVIPANATDWVLVELRDAATGGTVIGTKAGFIMNNGSVVSIDGVSPVAFTGIPAGNYHLAVRHRNHLGIRTSAAINLPSETNVPYDFTTGAGQANGTNAMVNVGTVYAMWAGDVVKDGKVASGASPSDVNSVQNAVANFGSNVLHSPVYALFKAYNNNDVNMDGFIKSGASPSDVNIIQNNVANYPTNVLHSPVYNLFLERL